VVTYYREAVEGSEEKKERGIRRAHRGGGGVQDEDHPDEMYGGESKGGEGSKGEKNGDKDAAAVVVVDKRWPCNTCGRKNDRAVSKCVACGMRKPLKVAAQHMADEKQEEEDAQAEEEARQKVVADKVEKKRKLREDAWACRICEALNKPTTDKCRDCGRMGRPEEELSEGEGSEGGDGEGEGGGKKVYKKGDPRWTPPSTDVALPGMLVLKMQGWTPHTLIYVPINEVTEKVESQTAGELKQMAAEDAAMRELRRAERAEIKREIAKMGAEDERMRSVLEQEAWEANLLAVVLKARADAAEDAPKVLATDFKKKMINDAAQEIVNHEMLKLMKARDAWRGDGVRPMPMGRIKRWRFFKATVVRLKDEFLSEQEDLAEDDIREEMAAKLVEKTKHNAHERILRELLDESIVEIAEECARTTLDAGKNQEETSQVVLVTAEEERAAMRGSVYADLLGLWGARKAELRGAVTTWGEPATDSEGDAESETPGEREKRLQKEQEEEREMKALLEMQKAEKETRKFLKQEMKACLKERRAMKAEEEKTRAVMREEKAKEVKGAYDVGGINRKAEPVSQKLNRKQELKRRAAEKQNIKREVNLMALEDELSHAMRKREMDAARKEAALLQVQLGGGGSDSDKGSDDSTEEENAEEVLKKKQEEAAKRKEKKETRALKKSLLEDSSDASSEGSVGRQSSGEDDFALDGDTGRRLRPPRRLLVKNRAWRGSVLGAPVPVPLSQVGAGSGRRTTLAFLEQQLDTAMLYQQQEREEMHREKKRRKKRLARARKKKKKGAALDKAFLLKLAKQKADKVARAKAAARLYRETQRAVAMAAQRELEWMDAMEEANLAKVLYDRATENRNRIERHCREIQVEHSRKQFFHKACAQRAAEAAARAEAGRLWVERAIPAEREAGRHRRFKERETMYMDTIVFHGAAQRFYTDRLYKELHWFYFYLLTETIGVKAEICSCERRSSELQELVQRTNVRATERETTMNKAMRKFRRNERLRLHRSALGREMFHHSQMVSFAKAFHAWLYFTRTRASVASNFTLRQGIFKQELMLRKVEDDHREHVRRAGAGGAGPGAGSGVGQMGAQSSVRISLATGGRRAAGGLGARVLGGSGVPPPDAKSPTTSGASLKAAPFALDAVLAADRAAVAAMPRRLEKARTRTRTGHARKDAGEPSTMVAAQRETVMAVARKSAAAAAVGEMVLQQGGAGGNGNGAPPPLPNPLQERVDAHKVLRAEAEKTMDIPSSLMHKHQRRRVECVHCRASYFEQQNHSQICEYHTGAYKLLCPLTCPRRASGHPDAVKCISHYKLRWSCCDQVGACAFGHGGCARRWHVREKVDARYRTAVDQIVTRDLASSKKLAADNALYDKDIRAMRSKGLGLLNATKASLKSEREIVARYNNLNLTGNEYRDED
jgi:hypothetical protein